MGDIRYLLLGLVIGIVLFIQAFRWLIQKNMIENIPTSKIRSLAMGLVEIKGKVKLLKEQLVTPFTNKPCSWYRYSVEELRSNGKSSYWHTLKSGTQGVLFDLEDNTGSVLVDPTGAKIDAPVTFRQQGTKEPPVMVKKYLESNGLRFKAWIFNKNMRYMEYALLKDQQLYIMGTADDNPYVEESKGQKNTDDIMIQKGKNEKFYFISNKDEKDLVSGLRWKMLGGFIGGGALITGCSIGLMISFNIL